MPLRTLLVIPCAVICVAGCSPQQSPKGIATAVGSGPITAITLSRGECFWGTCPVYEVSLSSDGSVRYVGSKSVKRVGEGTSSIPPETFRTLAEQIAALGFFDLSARYTSGVEGCRKVLSDQPTATFKVSRGSASKEVLYYYGCEGIPQAEVLSKLALAIDNAVKIRDLGGYYE